MHLLRRAESDFLSEIIKLLKLQRSPDLAEEIASTEGRWPYEDRLAVLRDSGWVNHEVMFAVRPTQ